MANKIGKIYNTFALIDTTNVMGKISNTVGFFEG